MTQMEAYLGGMIWGLLSRSGIEKDPGWKLTVPSYGSDDPDATAEVVIHLPSGTELTVTVTETRHARKDGGAR